jgi:glutamate---cysteine ligase / carboxylate-amine ligase
MSVSFNKSKDFTLGVELEVLLTDPHTQKPYPSSPELINLLHESGYMRFKSEFNRSTIEIESPVSPNVPTCRSLLESDLNILKEIAQNDDFSVIAVGTHPFTPWMDMEPSPGERYDKIVERMQIIAKRIHVYGLHVHVGLSRKEDALTVMNSSLQYIPHLIALSANSPYWGGLDTGLESFRFGVMDSIPFADIPPYFSNWEEFSNFLNILKKRKIIKKMKDVYWHIRPSPDFGTIEFRVCDIPPTLDEAMALAAMIQCLVIWIINDVKKHPEKRLKDEVTYAILPENIMMAERYGLEGEIFTGEELERVSIKKDIARLLHMLTPIATEYGCLNELNTINQIITMGNGAHRQRRCFRETKSHQEVVRMLEQEFFTSKMTTFQ